MEENIYEVLSRHFLGEISEEEKMLVEKFRSENPDEYAAIKALLVGKEIAVKNFDSHKAWQNVAQRTNRQDIHKTKPILLFRPFLKVAAMVALLIIASLSVYYVLQYTNQDIPMITVKGENQQIMLSDGSVVWLNDSASLSYPEKFSDDERTVKLTGEGFFDIARNPEKPFTIHTENANVKVLGTSFNVQASDHETAVSVKTGTVEVKANTSQSQVVITAGYSAHVQDEKAVSFATTNLNYDAWNTGILQFDETPIQDVIQDLNSFYDQEIQLTAKDLDCGFTAKFNNQPLSEVLEILKLICNVSVEETDTGYKIIKSSH